MNHPSANHDPELLPPPPGADATRSKKDVERLGRPSPPASAHRPPANRVRPPPAPLPGWVAPVALFLLGRAARRIPVLRFASWGMSAWLAWKEAAAHAEPTHVERSGRRIEP